MSFVYIFYAGFPFEGPFPDSSSMKNKSGVYVILDRTYGEQFAVDTAIAVHEAEDVRKEVEDPERSACWEKEKVGSLHYAAYYCDEHERMDVEKAVRKDHNLPCGEEE
ncbi:hypothetical protein J7K50_04345 [bacterium]|nr:hypothetical protein [bacterium]